MTNKEKQKLTDLIEFENGVNWWQPNLFDKHIKSKLPKELEIVSDPPAYEINYNCFAYALGLYNYPEFLGGNNPVQQEFIKYLIENKTLEIIMVPRVGDYVLYQDFQGDISHIAILEGDGIVISKWMWGPIIKNKVLNVPSSFGDKIFYIKKVETEKIKLEYQKYKETGVEIKPIR